MVGGREVVGGGERGDHEGGGGKGWGGDGNVKEEEGRNILKEGRHVQRDQKCFYIHLIEKWKEGEPNIYSRMWSGDRES